MEIRFDGKRALVTGAGKGIGRDIAKALYRCGAETVAISRTQEDLESLKAECPGIHTVTQDLTDWEGTREAVTKLGHFDLLVNNAGVNRMANFLDIFDTNFHSAFNVSQVVARSMVERGTGGAIVNMSSYVSRIGYPGLAAYASTKAAVDELTRAMAVELGPKKIRVNSVNPSAVSNAMGRYGTGWGGDLEENMKKLTAAIPLGKILGTATVT
ncbi:hypothetical protein BaRGS_00031986 [Batillaria attramentaria]|uniref:Ketoreductase domain-containing protein n=1 Tax=Batillaria attramentaria TaxID=370345 RepID=A0ABD0JPF5_9CAEN